MNYVVGIRSGQAATIHDIVDLVFNQKLRVELVFIFIVMCPGSFQKDFIAFDL